MGELGQVINADGMHVTVRLNRIEACAKCRACTAGMQSEEMLINAKNVCEAKKNDWVHIELTSDSFLKAIMIMYGVPFVMLVMGFFTGYYGAVFLGFQRISEVFGFSLGLIMMALAYALIKRKEPDWKKQNFTPVAYEIVDKG